MFERGIYKLWYIDNRPSPNLLKMRTSTFPRGPWSEPEICKVEGVPEDRELWHLDVVKVKDGYDALFVLINKGKRLRKAELYFGTSEDGVNWKLLSVPILIPSERDWDNWLIYRSTAILLEEKEVGGVISRRYAVWYSACSKGKEWHTGYTEFSVCINDGKIILCNAS